MPRLALVFLSVIRKLPGQRLENSHSNIAKHTYFINSLLDINSAQLNIGISKLSHSYAVLRNILEPRHNPIS